MILAGDIGATAIRAKFLKAFELAEIEVDPAQHRDLLTFVLVGRDRPAWRWPGRSPR